MEDLQTYRSKIEEIDREILRLLERRCELSLAVGAWKKANRKPVSDPVREKELLEKLSAQCEGFFPRREFEKLYRLIFRVSRQIQENMQ